MDHGMRIRWKLCCILLLAALLFFLLFFSKEHSTPQYSGEMVWSDEMEILTKELADCVGKDAQDIRQEIGEQANEEDWFRVFDQLLTYYQIEEQIHKEKLEVIGDHRVVLNEDFPDGKILCMDGASYSLKQEYAADLMYQQVISYVKGEQILAITERCSEPVCFFNAFVEEADEEGMEFYYHGYHLYHPCGEKACLEQIADLSFLGKELLNFADDKELISGKTLQITDHAVILEGKGEYEFAAQWEGYLLEETIRNAGREELPIGYEFTDYILNDGKIGAFLIIPDEQMETIRVALHNSDYQGWYHEQLILSSQQELQLCYGKEHEEIHEILPAGEELCLTTDSEYVKEGMLKVINPTNSGKIEISSIHRNQGIPSYRGNLEIRKTKEGLFLLNELLLEEYLYGVVPSEMSASYPLESLKAQAVCARTYAYGYLLVPGLPELGAHVDDSVNYQVYNNLMEKKNSTDAVRQTKGELLLYEEKPVRTYYYSTSCGYGTDDTIWKSEGEEATPYLKGSHIAAGKMKQSEINEEMNDEEIRLVLESVDETDYERNEPWYRWTYMVSDLDIEKLAERLKMCGISFQDFQRIKEITITERGTGGIARKLLLVTDCGEIIVEGEYEIRYVLNQGGEVLRQDGSVYELTTILPSAYLVLDSHMGKKGVDGFSITGGGFGHGVGMSQNGAKAMAEEGNGYEEILKMFYLDCQLAKKY